MSLLSSLFEAEEEKSEVLKKMLTISFYLGNGVFNHYRL